jgi:pimeloyl-ACP methyl ester carboxylesterase
MADGFAGLLDALHIDATHVFGISMGGMIAQEFALTYPEKVKTLILRSSPVAERMPSQGSSGNSGNDS